MLTSLSLRRSLPLLLGIFGLLFTVMLTAWHLPTRIEETLAGWRNHTSQHLALLQSSLSDHRRLGRNAELETELADLASLEGVRWAMVIDRSLQVIATTQLGLSPERLTLIDAGELAKQVNGGRAGWFGEGSRQLAIYPLDRVAQDGTPLREALLVEYDFAPMLAQTKREAWFYLAQTLTLLLLLGLILNRLYGRLLTRRLARIDQAARQFAIDQQPQNLSVGGRDEIGRLARTLNQMMNQLHERQLALSESEQLFRDLVDTAPIGMLVVDRELRVLQANPAAAALFGCTPAELLGNLPSDRLLESDATTRLLSTPANTPLELTGRRHDREVPLEISCTPFQRYGVRHFLVLLRDISDRLRAEQRLRFLAHFDPLTQLANRNYLVQRRTAARGAPAADAALPRPGPLQAHQRQPRPRDRRQAAGADRRPPGPADARACAAVAQRWRRIHAAARRQRPRPRRAAGPVHHRRLPAAGAHRPVRVLRQPEHRRCHQRRPAQCQRPAQTGGPRPVCGQGCRPQLHGVLQRGAQR